MMMAVAVAAAACGDDEAACDAGTDCASGGGSSEGGAGAGGDGGEMPSSLAETYCDCMLLTCHDAYHDHFGPESDEEAARAACWAEAETLPVAGMDVDSGNFVECRIHYCASGSEDADTCAATIGEGACGE
jgi:hypothetical protein